MWKNETPLFTLTVGEFINLTRSLVDEKLRERESKEKPPDLLQKPEADTFNIKELAAFLRCSKVSIHNYKKMGMPFYRIGRKIVFKKTEVLNFMRMLRDKATSRKREQST